MLKISSTICCVNVFRWSTRERASDFSSSRGGVCAERQDKRKKGRAKTQRTPRKTKQFFFALLASWRDKILNFVFFIWRSPDRFLTLVERCSSNYTSRREFVPLQ